MSTVQPACRAARPVSLAMLNRRSAYPSKPSARQNRVTVAGEVPLRSASSTIVARAAPAGSVSTCSATRCRAPVNSVSRDRIRTRTPSEAPSAAVSATAVVDDVGSGWVIAATPSAGKALGVW